MEDRPKCQKGTSLVERRFIGEWFRGPFKGHLDLVYLRAEKSKPLKEISNILMRRGFEVACESTMQKKVKPQCIVKNEGREARIANSSRHPRLIENTTRSPYPILEPVL